VADDEDTVITLDSGEQVRVTSDGQQFLIPGPDPEIARAEEQRAEREARLAAQRAARLEALTAKQALLASDPSVPPEKRIF